MYGRPREEFTGKEDPLAEKEKGELITQVQKEQAIEDSLIACTFGNSGLDLENYAGFLMAATGMDAFEDPNDLLAAGERIVCIERCFNTREGFSRKDDTIPRRMLSEPLQHAGPATDQIISNLDNMLDEYYQALGYTKEGIPTVKKLKQLGLYEAVGNTKKKGE